MKMKIIVKKTRTILDDNNSHFEKLLKSPITVIIVF